MSLRTPGALSAGIPPARNPTDRPDPPVGIAHPVPAGPTWWEVEDSDGGKWRTPAVRSGGTALAANADPGHEGRADR